MTTKHSCRRFNWLSARLVMSAVWFDPENAKGFSFTSWVQNLKSTSKLPDHPRTMCPSEAWVTLRGCYVGTIRLSTDYRKVTLRIGNSLVQISNLLLIGQTKRPAVPTWSDGWKERVWKRGLTTKQSFKKISRQLFFVTRPAAKLHLQMAAWLAKRREVSEITAPPHWHHYLIHAKLLKLQEAHIAAWPCLHTLTPRGLWLPEEEGPLHSLGRLNQLSDTGANKFQQ